MPAGSTEPNKTANGPPPEGRGYLLALLGVAAAAFGLTRIGDGGAPASPPPPADGPGWPGGPEVERPTKLMFAAMHGDSDGVSRLLKADEGGSINAYTNTGLSALHFALQGRMNQMQSDEHVRKLTGSHELCIKRLLAAGADPMVGHLSSLWYSASYRNVNAMERFIDAKADVNDRADGGWSLLHEVSASKAAGMARFFMKPEIDKRLLKLMRLDKLAPAEDGEEPYSLKRLHRACRPDDVGLLIKGCGRAPPPHPGKVANDRVPVQMLIGAVSTVQGRSVRLGRRKGSHRPAHRGRRRCRVSS